MTSASVFTRQTLSFAFLSEMTGINWTTENVDSPVERFKFSFGPGDKISIFVLTRFDFDMQLMIESALVLHPVSFSR